MNHSLKSVLEFNTIFGHPVGSITQQEELSSRQLRLKLIFEELTELAEASDCKNTMAFLCANYIAESFDDQDPINEEEVRQSITDDCGLVDGHNVNQVEELDALCDLQYVLNGKIVTGGYHMIFDQSFDTVHENNMSKLHRSIEHANGTIAVNGLKSAKVVNLIDGRVILYNSDGKIIKPHDHKKVALHI